MNINDVFEVLEQLGITGVIKNNKIYFLDLESKEFMKIYENDITSIPVEKFKANTFYSIYSPSKDKMARIHLRSLKADGKVDEERIILSHVDYFDGQDDYSIDLTQIPNPSVKIEYKHKNNDQIDYSKELNVYGDNAIIFTDEKKVAKGILYNYSSYDKKKENKEKDMITIREELDTDKVEGIFLKYYSQYHKPLSDTLEDFRIKTRVYKKD